MLVRAVRAAHRKLADHRSRNRQRPIWRPRVCTRAFVKRANSKSVQNSPSTLRYSFLRQKKHINSGFNLRKHTFSGINPGRRLTAPADLQRLRRNVSLRKRTGMVRAGLLVLPSSGLCRTLRQAGRHILQGWPHLAPVGGNPLPPHRGQDSPRVQKRRHMGCVPAVRPGGRGFPPPGLFFSTVRKAPRSGRMRPAWPPSLYMCRSGCVSGSGLFHRVVAPVWSPPARSSQKPGSMVLCIARPPLPRAMPECRCGRGMGGRTKPGQNSTP